MMKKLKKGWINIHIDTETEKLYISNSPYSSKKEAETGIFIGGSIQKLGTFEIEYVTEK